MKIKGKTLNTPNEEYIVLPRGNSEPIVLTARAVLEMDDFDQLCPRPEPPTITFKDGSRKLDHQDRKYTVNLEQYGEKRTAYIILKSLEATEGLEWEKCNLGDPTTWLSYTQELRESGFSDIEIQRIIIGVLNANSLNEAKITEARNHFLASMSPQNGFYSPVEEPTIT